MVVFTCNHCGDSLQKPKVEKHYAFACRRAKSLTCVDCFKDFRNEEYVEHTKCITEEERYAAKGSKKTGVVKKGEVKQESWTEMLKSIITEKPNLPPQHKNLLQSLGNYTNIPRKKHKFINFLNNSVRRVSLQDKEAVWEIIEQYNKEHHANNSQEQSKDGKNAANERKKRKTPEETEAVPAKKSKVDNGEQVKTEKFDFQSKILDILKERQSISLKKLQKKVINAYLKHTGLEEATAKTLKKYDKKLRKLQGVNITDDLVTLKQADS